MKREDEFEVRRTHLKDLTDQQLYDRFWDLCAQLVDPLLSMGREYTSPAIERSVLLRMGFSSLEVKAIVNGCMERNLLQHGAGNVVYKLSQSKALPLREAGVKLANGELWEDAAALFEGGAQ